MKEPVLVCEAQAIGMIGVIRSLGRAGYEVHAVSQHADALGFLSRHAARAECHPPYVSPNYIEWLDAYLSRHRIQALVPSEGFLLAVRGHIEKYLPLMPDAPDPVTLYRSFAKCDVQAALQGDASLNAHMPRGAVIQRGDHVDARAYADWHWPLYVKNDGLHADTGHASSVRAAHDTGQLERHVADALRGHSRCMIQESVPGVKATVNLWRHRGEIHAESMCIAMHENPHTGGLTAYRRVWWHDAMCADAKARLLSLNWQGVAMVEYKWDEASQRFWFIEINARYWNALNLDLLSDKDFPRWQLDAFLRRKTATDLGPGKLGFRARYTVPADIGYVMSTLRDPGVSIVRKLGAVAGFAGLALHPGVHSDLWMTGDRGLYWHAWWRFISRLGRG